MSDQPVAEAATYTTQKNIKTNVSILSEIRTYDPRNQAFALAFNRTAAGMQSTKFQDWHYKNYLRERNDTSIVWFSTQVPCNCTHRFAPSYGFWMPLQKSSFAIVFNVLVTAFWMSEIESKRRPFKWDFTFGNKSNQQVANKEGGRAQSLFVEPKTA